MLDQVRCLKPPQFTYIYIYISWVWWSFDFNSTACKALTIWHPGSGGLSLPLRQGKQYMFPSHRQSCLLTALASNLKPQLQAIQIHQSFPFVRRSWSANVCIPGLLATGDSRQGLMTMLRDHLKLDKFEMFEWSEEEEMLYVEERNQDRKTCRGS